MILLNHYLEEAGAAMGQESLEGTQLQPVLLNSDQF